MCFHLSPLTFKRFQLLTPRAQFLIVVLEGIQLAKRGCQEAQIALYHLADERRGFFIEVGYDTVQRCYVVLRSFIDSIWLEDYLQAIILPGL